LWKFVVVVRAALRERLDKSAGNSRRVQKQDAARFTASTLPSMRAVARYTCTSAGSADGDFVASLEGDLASEHPGDFVALVVQVIKTLYSNGYGLLEDHDALARVALEEL
jgi:hypothetical protein